jgi:hypothetical protein
VGPTKLCEFTLLRILCFGLSHIWQVTGGVVLSKRSSAILKTGTSSRAHRQLSSFGRGSHRLWGWSRLYVFVCVCVCVCVFSALPPVCVAILRFFLSLVSGLGSGLLFMSSCLLVSLRSKDYILDRHAQYEPYVKETHAIRLIATCCSQVSHFAQEIGAASPSRTVVRTSFMLSFFPGTHVECVEVMILILTSMRLQLLSAKRGAKRCRPSTSSWQCLCCSFSSSLPAHDRHEPTTPFPCVMSRSDNRSASARCAITAQGHRPPPSPAS